ncbi:MAG TPA: type IV pilus biogenesis/stability protein PilW [Candidatus Luteimonas excrementigallinarum]|nr:type IV pilus biogenesis/stability protein PilW [Candidatus Luteimonas excrementigallinarum]
MRRRDALLLAAAVAIAASACSRLTFIKPSAERGRYEQVAPDYSFNDSPESRRRMQVQNHVAEAGRALDAGQIDQAEQASRAALKIDGRAPSALTMMALVEMVRGRSEEAGRYYASAAEYAPDDGPVLNNYGAWLCRQGRAAESMAYFERAVADPGYGARADALANAGACAEAAGRGDRTEAYLRAALKLHPENSVALSAMAEYQYRNGQYLEARAFSQRRLAAAPATAEALMLASQIEERMGDSVAAERYRRRLGTEFPHASQQTPGG